MVRVGDAVRATPPDKRSESEGGAPAEPPGSRLRGLALAFLLTLPALWLLSRPGFFQSDDGLFHLYRLAALDDALHVGVAFPRWFPDFAFGYGFPVLNFYSPLSYYLAELFHLAGGGLVVATKLAFGASLVFSALAVYLFARPFLGVAGGLLASLAYTYAPYHLADVYRRGALAESLAFVWFPLILWLGRRVMITRRLADGVLLGAAIAGLILTHNLSAMLFMPLAVAYFLFVGWQNRVIGRVEFPSRAGSGRSLALLAGALCLAAGLAAFYVLPVLAESRFAHLSYDYNSTGYLGHLAPADAVVSPLPAYRYFPDQEVASEHPLGLVQTLLAVASLWVIWRRLRARRPVSHLIFWWVALLVGVGMTLRVSLPIWQLFQPLLSMVQYPWRFMSLADLSTALLAGSLLMTSEAGPAAASQTASRWPVPGRYLVLGGAALALMGNALPNLATPVLPLGDRDVTVQRMWAEDYAAGQIGATWTAEYLPLTVQEERWAIPRAPVDPPVMEPLPLDASVRLSDAGLTSYVFEVDSSRAFPLRLHAFWFPGWTGTSDGGPMTVYPSGSLGLVTVDVPPGRHVVRLAFEDTAARSAGGILSAVGLAIVLVTLLVGRRSRWPVIACGVVLVVLMAAHLWQAGAPRLAPNEARLENSVRLLGSRVAVLHDGEAGDRVRVDLCWMAIRSLPGYKVFVHVIDAAGVIRAQQDGDPGGGFSPTSRWLPGEIVIDTHEFLLPADLLAGSYTVLTGIYDFQTMRNLEARDAAGAIYPDARIPVGRVAVEGP